MCDNASNNSTMMQELAVHLKNMTGKEYWKGWMGPEQVAGSRECSRIAVRSIYVATGST
jgi:hypothetical protein